MSICLHEDVEINSYTRQSLFNYAITGKLKSGVDENEYDNTFGTGIVVNNTKKTHIPVNNIYICNVSTATSKTKIYPKGGKAYTFEELINSHDCYSDLNLLYNFYENNKSMILAILKILSDDPNANEIRNIYDLISNTKPKYSVTIDGTEIKGEKNKGKSLHEVIILFVQKYASENIKDTIDFFNKIRTDYAFQILQRKDLKRYDVFKIENNEVKYECRADKYKGNNSVLYVSNQWGSLTNGKGTFDKFLELIKDKKYSSFQLKAL